MIRIAILLFITVSLLLPSCKQAVKYDNNTIPVVETYSDLQTIIDRNKDKLLVVNFWATTCPPCLREMPHFTEIQEKYGAQDVKILLVSLDRVRDLSKRVIPFVKKHNIIPEVILLGDDNYSAWTDNVDSLWYGALPATMIINNGQKKFKFGAYDNFEELEKDIKDLM